MINGRARCLCGNLCPPKELVERRCIPCRREAAKKVADAAERDRLEELRYKYLSGYPFTRYFDFEE